MSTSPSPSVASKEECQEISPSVPSLTNLCMKAISVNLEKYPAESFGLFSEDLWDKIVKYRHESTAPKAASCRGTLADGRSAPAISERIMREIETENPHLRNCALADTLVWKDCVEYKFKSGGTGRPKVLSVPWSDLVSQVKEAGQGLTEVASASNQMYITNDEIEIKITEFFTIMNDCPMSVPLLKATDIGKKVSKVLKACQKGDAPDALASFKKKFHRLLESWKNLASASGVQVASSKSSNIDDCTGRGKYTSMQRYHQDVELLQNCHSWRDLFSILTERQNKLMLEHGQKMRTIRQNLDTNKHRVKKAKVASIAFASSTSSTQPRGTLRRLDEKLTNNKSPFTSQKFSRPAGNTISKSKMALLKKETARRQTNMTKATLNQINGKRSQSVFAASVSNMNGEKKRALPQMQKESQVLSMGSGKQLKLPSSKTARMLQKERVNSVRR